MPLTNNPVRYKLSQFQDNIFQVQLATMISAGVLSLLATAISPLLTTCVLWFLGIQLFLSVENWHRWAKIDQPQVDIALDHTIKNFLGAAALLSATFVVQLHVISQMLLLTTTAVSLSAYFIYPCMQNTQKALNTALQQAAKDLDCDAIAELLQRGADPYSPNAIGNNAFHFAVQNNEKSLAALTLLKNKLAPTTVSQITESSKSLLDDNVKRQCQSIWTTIQVWLEERNKNNFYPILHECKNLWSLCEPRLTNTFNKFVSFLRSEMSVPDNLHYKNNAGCTPKDLIAINITSEMLAQKLHTFLSSEKEPQVLNQPPKNPILHATTVTTVQKNTIPSHSDEQSKNTISAPKTM